jgi:hypothetical protein
MTRIDPPQATNPPQVISPPQATNPPQVISPPQVVSSHKLLMTARRHQGCTRRTTHRYHLTL